MEDTTPQASAVMQAIRGAMGLFDNVNKANINQAQSVNPKDEYTSKISDDEIITLTATWKRDYEGYYRDIEKMQKKSFAYWLGNQRSQDAADTIEGRDIVVNKLFEAIETFLPIATRANPEPLVTADNSTEGQKLASDVKEMLVFQADTQKLRRKLARGVRHWMLNLIGAWEIEYDVEIDDIKTTVMHPKRFIFDKEGFVDESGFFQGEYIGIEDKKSARRLIEMFPEKAEIIRLKANGKLGTKLKFYKWWYKGQDIFYTIDAQVLGKFKNPHWNYNSQEKRTDETGAEIVEEVQGINHLKKPTAPYVFLTIFNTGLQPHDETSLIIQNISQQDQINKRARQLDKNIDSQNNGLVVDGRIMTQEQAGEAAGALRRGASIRVMGDPHTSISRPVVPQLGSDVWKALETAKGDLANIFGVSGSTPTGIKSEETARGKIMVNQMDASRIGGGITEYIEQIADSIYNLWIQMMFVHYDNEHYVNAIGQMEGGEIIALKNTQFTKSLAVTVKEGSLVPKDPLTQRNEAMDLWSANAIDPLSLYKKLDFPDPATATQNLILWQMLQKGAIQPQQYLPSFQIQTAPTGLPGEQPGTGGPAVNAPTGQEAPVAPAAPGTQTAEEVQSKQLLQSVPIK